jgi:hypothetical protein
VGGFTLARRAAAMTGEQVSGRVMAVANDRRIAVINE